MKIGSRELLFSHTFLIPKGEVVSGTVPLGSATLSFEILVDNQPSEDKKNRLDWSFFQDISTWRLTIYGPASSVASNTTDFSEIASLDGEKIGFVASFYGTEHLTTLHLQIMRGA